MSEKWNKIHDTFARKETKIGIRRKALMDKINEAYKKREYVSMAELMVEYEKLLEMKGKKK